MRSEFPAIKEIVFYALLHRLAEELFTSGTTTQDELWYIGIATLDAVWLVLRVVICVVAYQLLFDFASADRTFRLEKFPKFVLFR